MVLDCGLASQAMQPNRDSAVIQFVSPGGRTLPPEEVKGLAVTLSHGGASRELKPSPKGCVAVPSSEQGLLKARVGDRGWALVHPFSGLERGSIPLAMPLGTEVAPQIVIDCAPEGWNTAHSLGIPLSLQGLSDERSVRLELALIPRGSRGTALVAFAKDFGEQLDSTYLDLRAFPEGRYELQAHAFGLIGPLSLTGNRTTCPIRIDRTPPTLTDGSSYLPNDVVTKPQGSFERFAGRDSDGTPTEVLACMEEVGPAPTSRCDDETAFRTGDLIAFEKAGLWRVHVLARDNAGNASERKQYLFRVDGAGPQLEARWENSELNHVGGVILGGKRTHAALIRLEDDATPSDALAQNLECKVSIKVTETGAFLEGDFAECESGHCNGKSLGGWVPCGGEPTSDGEMRIQFSLRAKFAELHQNLTVLSVRTRDMLDRVGERQLAFWNALNYGHSEWKDWFLHHTKTHSSISRAFTSPLFRNSSF